MKIPALFPLTLALILLGACATQPQQTAALEQAREAVAAAEQSPAIEHHAPVTLREAQQQLQQAEQALQAGDRERADHLAYLARQRAAVAEMEARRAVAEESAQEARRQVDEARLQAREQEAQRLRQEAEEARRQLAEMEAQLADMEPRQTGRGIVLTLDEVQFGFDSAELRPGSDRSMERLAQYLLANPEQRVAIEGHTDSVGDPGYNRELSERRAEAVREALVRRGVEGDRIETQGLGEDYPIASNETEAGRAQNRRVEIVVAEAVEPAAQEPVAEAEPGS